MQGVIGDPGAAGEQVKLFLCTGQVYTIVAPSFVELKNLALESLFNSWIRES